MKLRNLCLQSLALVFVLGPVTLAVAQGGPPASIDFAERAEREARLRADVQAEYRELKRAVEQARARYSEAQRFVVRERHRRRLRGETRADAFEELDAARAEVEQLETELAAFPGDVQRAGLPPGWLRQVDDE